jgi:hypothetical protein
MNDSHASQLAVQFALCNLEPTQVRRSKLACGRHATARNAVATMSRQHDRAIATDVR